MKIYRTLALSVLLFCFLCSHAGGINFLNDKTWKEVLAQARRENKLIFLDAYASWCGPCKYMQHDVFSDVAVAYYFNKNFINVRIDMEKGEGPQLAQQLGLKSFPTLYFINGDGQVLHKKTGAMEASEFLQVGEDARNPSRQFYAVRDKAISGNVSPGDFHQWIHEAEEMDEDVDSVIVAYLTATKNTRMEKETLSIMLDHAPLNKDQIGYLFQNRDSCMEIIDRSAVKFNASLLSRVTVWATNESLTGDVFDFEKFRSLVATYFPEKAALVTQKVKIRYYQYKEEYSKSLDELANCIRLTNCQLTADDLPDLITQNIRTIVSQDRVDEFIQIISQYNLTAKETTKACQKDLSLLALYYCKNDRANMKLYSDKILNDTNASDEIKSKVKDILDDSKER